MITKGIRGAISVDKNTSASIETATLELLEKLIKQNGINKGLISHVIFTLTKDLTADFPAKFARLKLGWDDVAMMCFNEAEVENSLSKCLRVMIVINCAENFKPKYVYLKGAKDLRKN